MANKRLSRPLLLEASWEVCNKVGGIYTVLSTKANILHESFGDNLVFVGPDVWDASNVSPYFKESPELLQEFENVTDLPFDIKVRVGRWVIPSMPLVVLVDFKGVYQHLDEIFGEMWRLFGVDSLHAYGDYPEGCAFAVASAIVMKRLAEHLNATEVTAHFNEWTTGMGLLYLRKIMPEAASLFTTHATSIGRSICSNGKALYDYFEGYNGTQMASELNMEAKHSVERAAAHAADCFTTVSEVTARECRQLLDIAPQVVTPNGFEQAFVPSPSTLSRHRKQGRERLRQIVQTLTGRDPGENTCYIATSGRGEFRNKGIDLFIESINRLPQDCGAVAFVLVPGWADRPATHAPYMTHTLHNEDSDMIARTLRERVPHGVPIIYVPCYLDGHDGVVNINYYDLLPAFDLTVFPSYYEPWGYTPLESVAFHVPTLTTDKAGFGCWVSENYPGGFDESGVEVVKRTDSNFGEAADEIAGFIADWVALGPVARRKMCARAAKTGAHADWHLFIQRYYEAFDVAHQRAAKRLDEAK